MSLDTLTQCAYVLKAILRHCSQSQVDEIHSHAFLLQALEKIIVQSTSPEVIDVAFQA